MESLEDRYRNELRKCGHCEQDKPLTQFYDKFYKFKRYTDLQLCLDCKTKYFRECTRCGTYFNWTVYVCKHNTVCSHHFKTYKPRNCDCNLPSTHKYMIDLNAVL